METRKKTTGVLVWTPAPAHTLPTSSVIYDVWKDQKGHEAEIEDDFDSQMDENGIIGLSEVLENVKFEETCSNADLECNQACHSTLFTSEEVHPSRCRRDTPPEELSDHLSDIESPDDDMLSDANAWAKNETLKRIKEQGKDVSRSMKHKEKSSTSTREENKLGSTSGKLGATNNFTKSLVNNLENIKIRLSDTPAGVSSLHCPVSQFATAVTFPHLLHFTAEELAASPGIDAETFPEIDFVDSLPDSHSSPKSSPRYPREEQKGHHSAAICPIQVVSRTFLKSRQSPDSNTVTNATKTRTKPAEVNEFRKGHLSYRTPDFSKVEPRVCFPKSGYIPPKSRLSSKKNFLPSGSPLIFKSPAEIVKEVLLDASDEPPSPSACDKPSAIAPSYTVPYDFRCRQQATTLLEQLQEDYNRLLTKYAEAENTIDRLRLEAKVNLYADLPNPRHTLQLGLNHSPSKLITLDFAQAQKADKSDLHSTEHSSPPREQVDKILCIQADRFLQQLQTYQDILRREKLEPSEQMKGLSQLAESLNSLERGYLLARDEQKRLQQQGAEVSHFDPERELEGLIYQCGLYMDELKERVQEMQPMCEATPSPSSHPTLSCVPSEEEKTLTPPQTPPVPLLIEHGGAVEVEVSSASEETDDMEAEDEITYKSFYLKPVTGKHKNVEQSSTTEFDYYQSFTESPRTFDNHLLQPGVCSTPLNTNNQPEFVENERQETGNVVVPKNLHQRRVKSVNQYHSSNASEQQTSKQQTSGFFPSSHRTSPQSTMLPVYVSSSIRRLAVDKSHSSSLSRAGEITASERRNSKRQTKSSKELSQDGIISPETDSGFVGSETSHLTPAAAQSPLHQRALESVGLHEEIKKEKPLSVSTTLMASSPSHTQVAIEPREASNLNPDQHRRSRNGHRRHIYSCSPQHWLSQTEKNRVDSGTSGFGMESDNSHSISEDGQSGQCNQSITSVHSSNPSSSPSMQYHHGNSLRAPGSRQAVNHNFSDAVQLLQAEVTTLKERLESFLTNRKPLSSDRAAPLAPCYKSATHIRPRDEEQNNVSRGRGQTSTDDEFEELRRATRPRSASAHRQKTQPDKSTVSELRSSTLPPRMSRCTQTPDAKTELCLNTNDVHNNRTHHRQHSDVSIQVSERGNEPDRTCNAPLCSQCCSNNRGPSQSGTVGGNKEVIHSSHCHHCPVCGQPSQYRSSKQESCRGPDSSTYTSCQPAESPDGALRSRFVAPPRALLQYMPMCPSPILLYPSPIYGSPSNSTGNSSVVRCHREVRERNRCSLSDNKQRSLDSSLNRAIRAAQHMKHTSRRMASSLATGLEYQELLTHSCSY